MSFLGNLHSRFTNPAIGTTAAYVGVAAGDVLRYSPPCPVQVVRWGFLCTTTVNDAVNALKLTCDLRPTAGTDTGRLKGATFTISGPAGYNASNQPSFFVDYGGNGTTLGLGGGSITLTAGTTQVVAGKGIYHNVAPQAPTSSTISGGVISALSGQFPAPDAAFVPPGGVDTQFVVYPGQEVVIASQGTAPGAGAGIYFIEVKDLPLTGDNNNNQLASSGVQAAISPTPSNAAFNLTRVNS